MTGFYFLVHILLLIGIFRVKNPSSKSAAQPFVTVIVAARNEEATIGKLLECLSHQSYTNKEIIIVDDRSTDRTAEIIESFKTTIPSLTCLRITAVPDDFPAKKNALRAAIQQSRGELLCFTDADCFPPPRWIEGLVSACSEKVGLVAGYSPYILKSSADDLLHRFISYEELRGGIWAAGSIGLHRAWLCTGRSLAYRRSVYDEVGGFEKIKMSVSGDDDMFLQLVRRETTWNIAYTVEPETFVPTLPPKTFRQFLNQRKRHFSTGKYLSRTQQMFFAAYHGSNVLLFLTLPLAVLVPSMFWFAIFALLKFCADAILLIPSFSIFKTKHNLLLMEILYIAYNTFIGPLGLIASFEWKTTAPAATQRTL